MADKLIPHPGSLKLLKRPSPGENGLKYRGTHIYSSPNQGQRYGARISVNGSPRSLGNFSTEKEAAKAYSTAKYLKDVVRRPDLIKAVPARPAKKPKKNHESNVEALVARPTPSTKSTTQDREKMVKIKPYPTEVIDVDAVEIKSEAKPAAAAAAPAAAPANKNLEDYTPGELATYFEHKGKCFETFANTVRKQELAGSLFALLLKEGDKEECFGFLEDKAKIKVGMRVLIYSDLVRLNAMGKKKA